MKNARYAAFQALMRIENDNAYSNLVLDEVLSNAELDARDKAFVSNIFYGVLERRITLDHIIRKHSGIRLKKIETPVLTILRMAVYQLVFMDKVPDNAAVNEAVKLCKKEKLYRSSGFVNGILRSITRADERLVLPDEHDEVKYLSVKYSCPESIVKLWLGDYSRDITEGILKELFGRPPVFIAVNTLKTSEEKLTEALKDEGAEAEKTALENALRLDISGSAAALQAYKNGLFQIQDISSQMCCELLCVKDGDIVSDVCAAPGGKTLNIARRTPSGKVYAYDMYESRLKLIKSAAKRMGIPNISAEVRDAADKCAPLNLSDKVLCDVPCSGLGVLRRKPEIRYKEDTGADTLPDIQLSILENSAAAVKLGGTLLYSTCTLNKKENNLNAARFLERNKDFEPLVLQLPDSVERLTDEEPNCLTLFPQANGGDGFFIAAFRKKAEQDFNSYK